MIDGRTVTLFVYSSHSSAAVRWVQCMKQRSASINSGVYSERYRWSWYRCKCDRPE